MCRWSKSTIQKTKTSLPQNYDTKEQQNGKRGLGNFDVPPLSVGRKRCHKRSDLRKTAKIKLR